MSRTLTISAGSGRIYLAKADISPEGLELQIDFTSSQSSPVHCTSLYGTLQGDLFTSDSRGNITQFLFKQNRFSQHIRNIYPCSFLIQVNSEHMFLVKSKEVLLYQLNGKKLRDFKQHYSCIKGTDINYQHQTILTYSADCAVVWEISTWKPLRNLRSRGVSYSQVMFAPDGNSLITCFDDGKLYQWRLSDNKLEKQFACKGVVRFAISSNGEWVFAAVENAEICCVQMENTGKIEYCVKAIPGVTEILELKSYGEEVFVLGNNGRLYNINLNTWRIEFEIQLGLTPITYFSLSLPRLFLINSTGLVHVYDYKTLSSFFQTKNAEKIRKGLEEDLVYTYLEKTFPEIEENFEDPLSQASLHSKEEVLFTKLSPAGLAPATSPNTSISQDLNCQHELFKKLFSSAKLTPHSTKINHCSLKQILHVKSSYPDASRPLIWRFLLQLPNNLDSFAGLYQRGTHPDLVPLFASIRRPNQTQTEFSRTERVTSALCYWSSLLSKVDYLHEIVNPFINVYPGDDISCFEAVMALVLHWMQHWFEFFPNPPVVLIESVANILKFHNPELFRRIDEVLGVDLAVWTVMKNLLAGVVAHGDWVKIMDFVFTDWQEPDKLMFVVANFFLHHCNAIRKLSKHQEMLKFVRSRRRVNVEKFMKEVEEIYKNAGAAVVSFNVKLPICEGQYPLFTSYPRYAVQTREELAEEILKDMKEREGNRNYNTALKNKIESLEEKQHEFIMRTKELGLSNNDIIEQYHQEIISKRMLSK